MSFLANMPWDTLLDLLIVFSQASLLALGGGTAVLGEIQNNSVNEYHWLTAGQFVDVFAITQATPGPSMLIVSLIGYWAMAQHYPHDPWTAFAVGVLGMFVSTTATFLPSSLLAFYVGRWWEHFHGSKWRDPVEKGLSAVTVGLLFASAVIVSNDATSDLIPYRAWLVIGVSAVLLGFTKINPLILMGVAGALGYMQLLSVPAPTH
ncbi:MAG: chromate transporter [Opitutales bacterium]|jgi:chromate transporter